MPAPNSFSTRSSFPLLGLKLLGAGTCVVALAAAPAAEAGFRETVLRHLGAAPGVERIEVDRASLSLGRGRVDVRGIRLVAGGPGWRWTAEAESADVRFFLPRLLLAGTIDTGTARGVVLTVERLPVPGETRPAWVVPWGWLRRAPGLRVLRADVRAETVVMIDRTVDPPAAWVFSGVRATAADLFDTPADFLRAGRVEARAAAWRRDGAEPDSGGRATARARLPSGRADGLDVRLGPARLGGTERLECAVEFDSDGQMRIRPPGL